MQELCTKVSPRILQNSWMKHLWLQSLSVWLQATSKSTLVKFSPADLIQSDRLWGINGGLTTSHCVQWYWSKFILILFIKGKNNTVQIHNLKEKSGQKILTVWSSVTTSGFRSGLRNAAVQPVLQKCGADWQPYRGLSSEPALLDECTRGGRSVRL